jgi:hypothetical protein
MSYNEAGSRKVRGITTSCVQKCQLAVRNVKQSAGPGNDDFITKTTDVIFVYNGCKRVALFQLTELLRFWRDKCCVVEWLYFVNRKGYRKKSPWPILSTMLVFVQRDYGKQHTSRSDCCDLNQMPRERVR